MTVSTKNMATATAFNLPNQLTALRLALSIVLFGLIAFKYYMAAFVVFLVAASTDSVDGYLARRYGMVTTLGEFSIPSPTRSSFAARSFSWSPFPRCSIICRPGWWS